MRVKVTTRRRVQMTNDERDHTNDTGGDITKYRALVACISYLSQDRLDLKFAAMQVCCAMANPSVSDLDQVKKIWKVLRGEAASRVLVPLAAEW